MANKLIKYLENRQLDLLIILSLAYCCYVSLHGVLNGFSAFWFDPARDFNLALANINKLTLIGPPTGIPGVFYGPYWIWFISLSLLVSKDPTIAVILLNVIPYFTLFPFFLLNLNKNYSKTTALAMWWLFYLSSNQYITQLWNVNFAPLILLAIVWLITKLTNIKPGRNRMIIIFEIAILSALLVNFHFSLGFASTIATAIFVLATSLPICLKQRTIFKKFYSLFFVSLTFAAGAALVEVPFFAFEIRHNFLQTKALIKTITNAVFYGSAVVGQTGLPKIEIFKKIALSVPSHVLNIGNINLILIYILAIGSVIYYFTHKKFVLSTQQRRLLGFLFISILAMGAVYLSSKNPIFDYHFDGYEIIVILLIGLVIEKIPYLKTILYFWLFLLIAANVITFVSYFSYVEYKGTPLWLKKAVTKTVLDDANGKKFQVYAYSPALYTYDYDYLFKWLGTDFYNNLPLQNSKLPSLVYLIIPETKRSVYDDFINYRTSNSLYKSKNIWVFIDGTTILKRERN